MTTLRQRMTQDLKVRNRSARTIKTYIGHVAKFARHFGKSPAVLGPEEIRQYQVYLVRERKVSWSYFNQVVCALRFLYGTTLGCDWAISHIPFPRKPRKLPVVLSPAQVQRFLQAIKNLKYRAILMTAYAARQLLRVSQVTATNSLPPSCRDPDPWIGALNELLTSSSLTRCPACHQGQLHRTGIIGPLSRLPDVSTG